MTHYEARMLLGLDGPVTEKVLKSRWRAKCHEHHPDKGGNAETFRQINEAYRYLLESQPVHAAPPPRDRCPECHGKGYVESHFGVMTFRMSCLRCMGASATFR